MIRHASSTLVPLSVAGGKRRIIASAEGENIELDPSKLFFTTRALHWEQRDKNNQLSGNDNGDLFPGARNVVWACNNKNCANPDKFKRFLRQGENDPCPHCGGNDLNDWEYTVFHRKGELLTKNEEGLYRYQTWKGQPVNINHDEKRICGSVKDVWLVPSERGVDQLLEIDTSYDKRLTERIARNEVTGVSMEVLVESSVCPICFNVAQTEDQWCSHLKRYKGRFDPRTGQRIFEINRGLCGSGMGIIAVGEPADQKARIYEVFNSDQHNGLASKLASDSPSSTTLNQGKMATKNNKPQVSAAVQQAIDANSGAKKRSAANFSVRQSAGSDLPTVSVDVHVPSFQDMKSQIERYGGFNSARKVEYDEAAALASLPPELRKKVEALSKADPKLLAQLGLGKIAPLKVDRDFVAANLKALVATRKIASKELCDVLVTMVGTEGERLQFSDALTAKRGSKTEAVKRLASRRACLHDAESIREVVLDTLADALQKAADMVSQAVTSDTILEVIDGTDKLVDSEEHRQDFDNFLNEDLNPQPGEIASESPETSEAEESSLEKEALMKKEIPLEDSQVEAAEPEDHMNKQAQNVPQVKPSDVRNTSTSTTPGSDEKANYIDGNGLDKNPTPVEVPAFDKRSTPTALNPGSEEKAENAVMSVLASRKASLVSKLLTASVEDLPIIQKELKKVEAQIQLEVRDVATSTTPGSDEKANYIDGNGLDKNPQPIDVKHMDSRKTPTSTTPGSDEKASNVSETGGEEIPHIKHIVAQATDAAESKGGKPATGKLPEKRTTKSEEYPEAKDQENQKRETREQKKEVQPGNEDNMKEKEKATEEEKDKVKKDTELKNQGEKMEKTPDAANAADISGKHEDSPTTPKDIQKDIEAKGQEAETPRMTHEEQDKLQGKTEPSKAENPEESAKKKNQGTDPTKSLDEYGDMRSLRSDPDGLTYPGPNYDYPKEMLRSGKLITADFTENTEPGKKSASYWEVKVDSKPILKVSAKAAYEDEVIANWPVFAEFGYGKRLVAALQEHGVDYVANEVYEPGALEVVGPMTEKKAQTVTEGMPAQTNTPVNAPVNVAPEVADRVLNEAKPGLSVLDILVNLLAPVVIESDSLSVSGLAEDLVQLATNQDKVTQFTTRLQEAVDQLRSAAGLPSEQGAPATPTAPAPVAGGAPPPSVQPTSPVPQNYGTMAAQAMRIAGLSKELETSKKAIEASSLENRKLVAEKGALLRGQRIEQVVRTAQASGLIDNYNTFIRQGKSRKIAKEMAKGVADGKVQEFLKLPNEACEEVLNTMLKAARKISASADPAMARRMARFEEMKREAGGTLMAGMPGNVTEASILPANGKNFGIGLSIKWAVANGIDSEKHDEALKTVNIRKND